ncbi:MAG: zf-HC2 domain-containing protein [Desulfobacteraceae bacterium]|nr:MAG: zf-HC2 domain-containing protein [Desulfobacteraceae bacterium]
MRCSKVQRLISDYIDDLLESRQVQELELHLQRCQRCSGVLDEMRSIVNGAKGLKMAAPAENLWPAIRDGVERKRKKPFIRMPGKKPFFGFPLHPARPAYAAGAVLAVVFIVSVLYYGLPFIQQGSSGHALSKDEQDQLQLAGQHYQAAIDALAKAVSDQKTTLNPEIAAVFDENLKIIDDSIRACKAALKERQDNRVANLHLLICYRKKVELLNELRNVEM